MLYVSDAGSTPPPPPPPNLTPPPGYAAYEPTLAGAVTLKRIQGLRTAILILLGVYAIGALVAVAATPAAVDAARGVPRQRPEQQRRGRAPRERRRHRNRRVPHGRGDDRHRRPVDHLAVPGRRQPPGDRPPHDVEHRLGDRRLVRATARRLRRPDARAPGVLEGFRPGRAARRRPLAPESRSTRSCTCGGCCTGWRRSSSSSPA